MRPFKSRGHRAFVEQQGDSYGPMHAQNLVEYTWPVDSKSKWFIQEQVGWDGVL